MPSLGSIGRALGKGTLNPYAKSMVGGAMLGMGARGIYNASSDGSSGGYLRWGMMGAGAMMARRGAKLGPGAMSKLPFASSIGKAGLNNLNRIRGFEKAGAGLGIKGRNYLKNLDFVKKNKALGGFIRRNGVGFTGAGIGMMGGAGLGAAYGLISPKESMFGGAFKGAVMGAGAGAFAYSRGGGLSRFIKSRNPIYGPKRA